ncbi:hydrogenase maturation protease [Spartinivicinus poritis]|uniref:Hydrogenase maturation protease n=1 Tax=Spartinivicinus poritis TaxID=2994640 RepID=A0ABT5U380_9GAMM|nr:hydrogenase maturation protease [Spartinivicinus sp. A2-2]MDE1460824.1 hydrogenase maturation protease [Spartinivicinus sp. A2-2]
MISIRIIGAGNPLHGDDAIGYHAVTMLKQFRWPDSVELVDGNTGGLTLIPKFRHCKKVILIDCFNSPSQVGQDTYFSSVELKADQGADFLQEAQSIEHGGGIKELLSLVPLLIHPLPVIDIVAIGGANFTPFSGKLSEQVEQTLSDVCYRLHQKIIKELSQG